MSVNKYDSTTDTLTTLASGSRIWTGSEAAYKAEKGAGTLPTNALIMITDDEVDTCHYSTDETFTGMYWIDGKKIYRKVFQCGDITGSNANSNLSIPNINKVIDIQFDRRYDSSQSFRVVSSGTIDTNFIIYRYITDGIQISPQTSSTTIYDVTAIVTYTKTTD